MQITVISSQSWFFPVTISAQTSIYASWAGSSTYFKHAIQKRMGKAAGNQSSPTFLPWKSSTSFCRIYFAPDYQACATYRNHCGTPLSAVTPGQTHPSPSMVMDSWVPDIQNSVALLPAVTGCCSGAVTKAGEDHWIIRNGHFITSAIPSSSRAGLSASELPRVKTLLQNLTYKQANKDSLGDLWRWWESAVVPVDFQREFSMFCSSESRVLCNRITPMQK